MVVNLVCKKSQNKPEFVFVGETAKNQYVSINALVLVYTCVPALYVLLCMYIFYYFAVGI